MHRWLVIGGLVLLGWAPPASATPRPGFGWPLAGAPSVDRGFDPPQTAYGAGHRGVDLHAAVGQPVLAAGPGEVTYAGVLAGRGVVTVTHDGGLRTTYEPVSPAVQVGQHVARGSVLGRVGTGHASCRAGVACLHWGLLRGDAYLDPLSLVVGSPVRLLPLGPASPPPAPAPGGALAGPAPHDEPSSPVRGLEAAAAAGSLAAGISLLARRPSSRRARRPPPRGALSAPVDLRRERARRRAG
jgi:murein DD-endopeptidase MepM/ murein hydrolase activator NlpD